MIERIFAKKYATNCEKEIILGTSDASSIRRSSQRAKEPAYYIEDYLISSGNHVMWELGVSQNCWYVTD